MVGIAMVSSGCNFWFGLLLMSFGVGSWGCGSKEDSGPQSPQVKVSPQPNVESPLASRDAASVSPPKLAAGELEVKDAPIVRLKVVPGAEFAATEVTRGKVIHKGAPLFFWGSDDKSGRFIVGRMTKKGKRPSKWELREVATGKRIAKIPMPVGFVGRDKVKVWNANSQQALLDLKSGTVVSPKVELPNGGTVSGSVVIVGGEVSLQTWVLAKENKQFHIGHWFDFAKTVRLLQKVSAFSRYESHVFPNSAAIRPTTGEHECAVTWFQGGTARCVRNKEARILSDGWLVSTDESDDTLTMKHVPTGTREFAGMGCEADVLARYAKSPRFLASCRGNEEKPDAWIWWAPGQVTSFPMPRRSSHYSPDVSQKRVYSWARLVSEGSEDAGDTWIDILKGAVYKGPTLTDLQVPYGQRFLALRGKKGEGMAVVVDLANEEIRDAKKLSCKDETLFVQTTESRYVYVYCGIDKRNGLFDHKITDPQIFDLAANRHYRLPGPVEAIFSDGTVLISDRGDSNNSEGYDSITKLEIVSLVKDAGTIATEPVEKSAVAQPLSKTAYVEESSEYAFPDPAEQPLRVCERPVSPSTTDLDCSGQSDVDFKGMSTLTGLRSLKLLGARVGKKLALLGKLKQLEELDLSFATIQDGGFKYIAALKTLRKLDLRRANIKDDDLIHLVELTELRELNLNSTKVGDKGLAHLAKLTALEKIRLGDTKVTDKGLANLANLSRLKGLSLGGTGVTSAGMVHLSKLLAIEDLSLAGTRVTDSGLIYVARLQELTALSLSGPKVTDAGMQHLAKLRKLQALFLFQAKLSDAGLALLAQNQDLEHLDLRDTAITDASIPTLNNFLKLKTLVVSGTKISDTGKKKLKVFQ